MMSKFSILSVQFGLAVGFCLPGATAFAEAGVLQSLGSAVESASSYPASPPAALSPGLRLVFGDKEYAIFGTDACPVDPLDTSGRRDFECVEMTPGAVKSVFLVPVESKIALHAMVAITRTGQAVEITLTSLLYPDGRAQNITPPLVGRRVSDGNDRHG